MPYINNIWESLGNHYWRVIACEDQRIYEFPFLRKQETNENAPERRVTFDLVAFI